MTAVPPKSAPARSIDARLADVEAALARELRVSKALREVGVALGDHPRSGPAARAHSAEDHRGARSGSRDSLPPRRGERRARVAHRTGQRGSVDPLKIGHGIAGHVARTGKPLHVRDAYKDPRFGAEWDMLSGYRTRSILAAPMKNHLGKTIGVVQVLNKKRGEFTDDDADILAALATQAAVSIDNSRLFMSVTQKNIQLLDTKEQLEHRVHDLKLLFDLEHAMGRAASLEELFVAVLGEAMRACEARMGAVALRDPESGAGNSYLIDERAKKMKPIAVSGRRWAHRLGHPQRRGARLGDAETDPRRDNALDVRIGGGRAKRRSSSPSRASRSAPMGAIAIYNKRGTRPLHRRGPELLELIAANASTAIRLQLSREAREREERLTTIGRLLSSVIHDLKTPLTVISGYVQLMQNSKAGPSVASTPS
jgi:GAF domain-containing protein